MPDDASPPLRTAKADHAANLREERKLMRVANISRTQARAALAGYAKEKLDADAVKALQGIPRPRAEVVSTEVQAFAPRPLTLGDIPGQSPPGGGLAPPTNLNELLLVTIVQDAGTGAFTQETVNITGAEIV